MSNVEYIKPADFRIGITDNAGEKVTAIYFRYKDFVIYRTAKNMRLEFLDDEEIQKKYIPLYNLLGREMAKIYPLLPGSEQLNRQVSRAIRDNLLGNCEQAKLILADITEQIRVTKIIQGRLRYAISGLVVTSIMTFFLFLYHIYLHDNPKFTPYSLHLNIATCGAFGGVLSVLLNFSRFDIDIDTDIVSQYLVGLSRIAIAVIAALFSFFAIKSGLFLTTIDSGGNNEFYAIAMIAGFSEMFVPNLMSNLANQHSQEELGKAHPPEAEDKPV